MTRKPNLVRRFAPLLGGLAGVVVLILLWGWLRPAPAPDPVAAFLAGHWSRPLAAQGQPPQDWSALEASLAPESCAQCHAEQHRDWQGSLHHQTLGPGILWQARVLDSDATRACLDCHTPLAEQKLLLARELGWPGAPGGDPPAHIPPDLHRQGLVCAACHVRAHQRHGPLPGPGRPDGNTPGLPHGGFQANAAFSDSRFCASCHQFPEDGPSLNGKPLENTLVEWQASPYAERGVSCQDCHMPGRRHLWKGIHDPAMLDQAVDSRLALQRLDDGRVQILAELRNTGAGHQLPTYLVPRLWLRLLLIPPEARGPAQPLAEAVIGRQVDLWLTEEQADTRLAPGQAQPLSAILTLPAEPGWAVELRLDVAPRGHYERVYRQVLGDPDIALDTLTRDLLQLALEEAEDSRYQRRLQRLSLPVAD